MMIVFSFVAVIASCAAPYKKMDQESRAQRSVQAVLPQKKAAAPQKELSLDEKKALIKQLIAQVQEKRVTKLTTTQTAKMEQLLNAQVRGDMAAVTAAVNDGAAYYFAGIEEDGTLMWAAVCGYTSIVKMLLDRNASVHMQDSAGFTPLLAAVLGGHTEIVAMLLEKNANVNDSLEGGITALMLALDRKFNDIARILVIAGANTSFVEKVGDALPSEIVAVIKDAEVERDAVLYAMKDISCAEEIKGLPEQEIVRINALLTNAVIRGDIKAARKALAVGASLEVTDMQGNTPLMWAIAYNHIDIVRLFLERNVRVNAQSKTGTSPLMLAAANGNTDIIKLLLTHKAEVNLAMIHDGPTPLLFAALGGHVGAVKMLAAAGGDMGIVNKREMQKQLKPEMRKVIAALLKKDAGLLSNLKDTVTGWFK